MGVPARGRRAGNRLGGPRSVAEIATLALRERIISGLLPMGSHIKEQALADEIGVGRAALREALRTLERDGLIVHTPRAGSRVVTLSLQDAYDIVVLREHLEDLAIRLGVPCSDRQRLDRLYAAVDRMDEHARQGAEEASALDGIAYHQALIGLVGNRQLEAAYGVIAYPLAVLMNLNRRVAAPSETLAQRAARHRRLTDLIREGDAEQVRHESGRHQTTGFLRAGVLSPDGASPEALAWASARRPER